MAQVQKGDKVRIEYIGTLEDGSVFDSSRNEACEPHDDCDSDACCDDDCDCGCGHESGPVELIIGAGQLFPQIDEVLIGMAPGEKKTVTIPAAEAFGEYETEKVFTVERGDLPGDFEAEAGDELVLSNEDDEELGVLVVDINDREVTFDANHPLAGEDLTFELTLVEIL
jgi:peptidylprolyl isomerase